MILSGINFEYDYRGMIRINTFMEVDEMANHITRIKGAFITNFYVLGDCKDEIMDELDMAIYQHRCIRNTPRHDSLLAWGSNFLDAAGIE